MSKPIDSFLGEAAPTTRFDTYEVRNQAAAAVGFNAFDDDAALSGLVREHAAWAVAKCSRLPGYAQ